MAKKVIKKKKLIKESNYTFTKAELKQLSEMIVPLVMMCTLARPQYIDQEQATAYIDDIEKCVFEFLILGLK